MKRFKKIQLIDGPRQEIDLSNMTMLNLFGGASCIVHGSCTSENTQRIYCGTYYSGDKDCSGNGITRCFGYSYEP